MEEEFEDTKGASRIRISQKNTHHNGLRISIRWTDNTMVKRKMTKGQTTIYKTYM
jgi:hypothetical protein